MTEEPDTSPVFSHKRFVLRKLLLLAYAVAWAVGVAALSLLVGLTWWTIPLWGILIVAVPDLHTLVKVASESYQQALAVREKARADHEAGKAFSESLFPLYYGRLRREQAERRNS